jgi:Glycosyl transferase family 90/Sulfotransferase family
MPDQPLLCIVHIPKTAGSAIRETLISALGWDKVYWIGHKRPSSHWANATEDEFSNYAVVGGHCSASEFQKIRRPKIFMAVVRDPIRRAISLFHYVTRGPDRNHGYRREVENLSLIEAIEKSATFRKDVTNRQCGMIGDQPTFAAAFTSLCDEKWIIGRQEDARTVLALAFERFGWPIAPMVFDNVADEGYADQYFTEENIRALEEINREDLILAPFVAAGTTAFRDSTARQVVQSAIYTPPRGETAIPKLGPPMHLVEFSSSETLNKKDKEDVQPRSSGSQILPPLAAPKEHDLEIVPLVPSELEWLAALGVRTDRSIVARFRALPGTRPMLQVRDPSLLSTPRIAHSLRYVDDVISRFILHPEHYHRHDTIQPNKDGEIISVFQVGDSTADVPMTIGYVGNGCKTTLIPDLHFWLNSGYFSQREALAKAWIPWEKRSRIAFWRGSSTGADGLTVESIADLPRFRLCAAGAKGAPLEGMLDAKLTNIVQSRNAGEAERIRAFIVSCGLLSEHVPQPEFLNYRFQIDIDGNSNAWGLFLKLLMGSCVLKVMSEWRQWYYDELKPWEHYVPVKNDLSDLENQIAWCLDHDDDAREIGSSPRIR